MTAVTKLFASEVSAQAHVIWCNEHETLIPDISSSGKAEGPEQE